MTKSRAFTKHHTLTGILAACFVCLALLLLFQLTGHAATQDIYTYMVEDGTVTITDCAETVSGRLEIPSHIGGYPVLTIGASAFSGCVNLTEVVLPETVQIIQPSAFVGCTALEEVYVPTTVTRIGISAFYGCTSIKKISVPFVGESATAESTTTFGHIFGSNRYDLPPSLTEVVILGGDRIAKYAFRDCAYIERVYIGPGISCIEDGAFDHCPALRELVVDSANATYHSAGNCVIHTADKRLVAGCQGSVIPDDGSVTTVGALAFSRATGLKQIVVPNAVTKIEHQAFAGCSGLEEITIPFIGEAASGSSKTHFGYIFSAPNIESHNQAHLPTSLQKVTVTGDCAIKAGAFQYCDITTLVVTGNIDRVEEFSFMGCEALRTVQFLGGVGELAQNSFSGCTALEMALFLGDVETIRYAAFPDSTLFTVYCKEGTAIEAYAIQHNIPYVIIQEQAEDPAPSPGPQAPAKNENGAETGTGLSPVAPVGNGCASQVAGNGIYLILLLVFALCFAFRKTRSAE